MKWSPSGWTNSGCRWAPCVAGGVPLSFSEPCSDVTISSFSGASCWAPASVHEYITEGQSCDCDPLCPRDVRDRFHGCRLRAPAPVEHLPLCPLRICVGISVDIRRSPLSCLGPCDKVAGVKGWTEDSKHSRWLQVSYLLDVQHPDCCLNPLSDGQYQQVFENEYLWRKQGSRSHGTKSGNSCATEVMKSSTEDCSPGLDNKNSTPH